MFDSKIYKSVNSDNFTHYPLRSRSGSENLQHKPRSSNNKLFDKFLEFVLLSAALLRIIFRERYNRKFSRYAVAYEQLFCMLKHANTKHFEYCELKQRSVTERASFQQCNVKTLADGFHEFHFALQQVRLPEEHVKLLKNV